MCIPSVVYYAQKFFLKVGRHPSEKEEEKLFFEYSFTRVMDYDQNLLYGCQFFFSV